MRPSEWFGSAGCCCAAELQVSGSAGSFGRFCCVVLGHDLFWSCSPDGRTLRFVHGGGSVPEKPEAFSDSENIFAFVLKYFNFDKKHVNRSGKQ